MPAGDVFGLDGIFLTKSNPVVVSTIGINSTASGAGIAVTAGILDTVAGIATLNLSSAAGLSTTPFYVGAKIAVSGLADATGTAHTGYNGTFVVTGFAGTTTVSYATTGYVGSVSPSVTVTGLSILVTDTAVTNTTWSSAQTHGWFGGGYLPGSGTSYSTVDRIDFSNDTGTASIRGPLSGAKLKLAATGNSNYGWFGGGVIPTPATVSTVDRIDFSNDSSTASVRGPLTLARYSLAATGNSNYGWFGGGYIPSVPINNPASSRSTVDRIDFSNDSATASVRGSLSGVKFFSGGAAANSNYGWFGGGSNLNIPSPTFLSTVDRIDFSNDGVTASPRGPLSSARYSVGAVGNSNYGWFGGGGAFPTPALTTVNRIDFSNDSATALVRGPLSSGRYGVGATGNSNYGWFGGGTPGTSALSTVDRINFSNDSVTASPRGPLSQSKWILAATAGQARSSSTRLQKAGSYGWFGGGYSNPPQAPGGQAIYSTVDRIDFSNDSIAASPRGPLSSARNRTFTTGNSNYGWFGGGVNGPAVGSTGFTTVDRIDFSNDSATASVRGPLTAIKYSGGATGNSNYGWFGGGFIPSTPFYVSTVERINFSNDLATASLRSPLGQARYGQSATGNSNYGWFGGGFNPPSTPSVFSRVDRIDFSNDGVTASPRGPLSLSRYDSAATGNSNYGWFGGGNTGVSPSFTEHMSTVDRIDFSNDSTRASPRSSLTQARYQLAATGNSNYGWFGGGGSTPSGTFPWYTVYSTVERINFSNDLVSTSTRNPLSLSRAMLKATSNTTR